MNIDTKQTLHKLEETAQYYLNQLDQLTMEQLTYKTEETDWSLGQMYIHLINSALHMQLRNIELCRELKTNGSQPIIEGKSETGESIFALGSFPPDRIAVPPSPAYTPGQPTSKEQLVEGIQQVLKRMQEVEPTIAAIPAANLVAHPRLGGLNAIEWFALIEMHYRHHLLQNERLLGLL